MNTPAKRPRWRFNAAYGVSERLLVGLEHNPAVEEVSPTLNWTVHPNRAGDPRPLVTLGTSSDRIFSPPGTQSYYLTFAKNVEGTNVAPYLSLNYSEWERGWTLPFGLNYALDPRWSLMIQNDGRNTHWLINHQDRKISYSLLLVKGQHFGLSIGVRL